MPSAPPPPRESEALALQATALRYAAGDLPTADAALFERRLASEAAAQDALAEAVRLSAAALGQSPPIPDRSFRSLIRERLRSARRWPVWLTRRAYRGHPVVWVGLGAGVVVAATVVGLHLADHPASPEPPALVQTLTPPALHSTELAPPARVIAVTPASPALDETNLRTAEIWAELSTPDHVEKTHGEELRRKQRLRDLHHPHPVRPSAIVDALEP